MGIWTHIFNTWFLGPTRDLNPNSISIGAAVFVGLTSVADWQTDHATRSITIDRIYVCSTTMRPKKCNCPHFRISLSEKGWWHIFDIQFASCCVQLLCALLLPGICSDISRYHQKISVSVLGKNDQFGAGALAQGIQGGQWIPYNFYSEFLTPKILGTPK